MQVVLSPTKGQRTPGVAWAGALIFFERVSLKKYHLGIVHMCILFASMQGSHAPKTTKPLKQHGVQLQTTTLARELPSFELCCCLFLFKLLHQSVLTFFVFYSIWFNDWADMRVRVVYWVKCGILNSIKVKHNSIPALESLGLLLTVTTNSNTVLHTSKVKLLDP